MCCNDFIIICTANCFRVFFYIKKINLTISPVAETFMFFFADPSGYNILWFNGKGHTPHKKERYR